MAATLTAPDIGNDDPAPSWTTWCVAPGFEANDPHGRIEAVQVDNKNFEVTTPFRFSDRAVLERLRAKLVRDGQSDADARARIEDARTYDQPDAKTDLASIPPFMRWWVNTYGRHTLASIIHDRLIQDGTPNEGALRSDTASDWFFREMMGAVGVPWLKRWIMWAAVAMRTRWAASGWRRASLVLWGLLAVAGLTLFFAAAGAAVSGWGHLGGIDPWVSAGIAVAMPVVSAVLWGKQAGASIVAAIAATWILPAAILAAVGSVIYVALEWTVGRFVDRHRSA